MNNWSLDCPRQYSKVKQILNGGTITINASKPLINDLPITVIIDRGPDSLFLSATFAGKRVTTTYNNNVIPKHQLIENIINFITKAINSTDNTLTYDNINKPKHYTSHPSGIECIDITECLPFCTGNAIKYVWRRKHKGDYFENLKKAIWYIDRIMQKSEYGEIREQHLTPEKIKAIIKDEPSPINYILSNLMYGVLLGEAKKDLQSIIDKGEII